MQEQTLFERKFSRFHFPSCDRVESSIRFPHSDVTCISTCTARKKSRAKAGKVNLPYEELKVASRAKATPSLLQQKHSKAKQKAMDKLLHDEHRQFMSTLQSQRQARLKLETSATVTLQRMIRGFGVRQKLSPTRYERTPKTITTEEIWETLLNAISTIGIIPTKDMILGMDLPPEIASFVSFDEVPAHADLLS